jgi:hypothetical protein
MYVGHSGVKSGCTWVIAKKREDVHGLMMYEYRICDFFLRRSPCLDAKIGKGMMIKDLMH